MPEVSDELLRDVASNVASRIMSGSVAQPSRSRGGVMLALSADGEALGRTLIDLSRSGAAIQAVIDSSDETSPALASALTRLPQLESVTTGNGAGLEALLAGVDRVVAPSMSLALASRVASLQADTPAAHAILRSVLNGVPVEASLHEPDFVMSEQAPAGAKRAVDGVLSRLRELGVVIGAVERLPLVRAAAAGVASGAHASAERFAGSEPLSDFVDSLAGKPCSIEAGQPCVDCGVCEMRGF